MLTPLIVALTSLTSEVSTDKIWRKIAVKGGTYRQPKILKNPMFFHDS